MWTAIEDLLKIPLLNELINTLLDTLSRSAFWIICTCYFGTGIYDADIQVAVKLTMFKSDFTKELNIYKALNATDKDIETHGIPRVYCHGSFVSWTDGIVYFIAMTLFEGDLEARLRQQRGNISDLSLSLIFRRSASKKNFQCK